MFKEMAFWAALAIGALALKLALIWKLFSGQLCRVEKFSIFG